MSQIPFLSDEKKRAKNGLYPAENPFTPEQLGARGFVFCTQGKRKMLDFRMFEM